MKHILKIPSGNLADEASWGSGSVEVNAASYGLQGEIIVVEWNGMEYISLRKTVPKVAGLCET